jgi:predicted RNase H-like HicB family nuclease
MIREYVQAAMAKAKFKRIEDVEPVFGEIPPCPGVWATGKTIEECRQRLEEVQEGWTLLSFRFADPLPAAHGRGARENENGGAGAR